MDAHGMTVGVLGSYGGRNLGDEAILTSLLDDLWARATGVRIVVFTRDPEQTRLAHPGVEAVRWQDLNHDGRTDLLRDLDLLMLGGGGVLYDTEARRYLRMVRAAQEMGVPVFTYAVGAGPLTEPLDCSMIVETLGAAREVTVRDEESRRALEDAGLTRQVTVTADPAVLLKPEKFDLGMLHGDQIPEQRRLMGMSVREPGRAAESLDAAEYHALLAHVGDFLVHRFDAHLLFIPMESRDLRHAHAVLSHMTAAEHGRILHGNYRPRQILGLMEHLDLVVGMRLHFLIFAALAGVPALPLPYAGKVFDFARQMGAPALLGVVRESAGPLLAEVDRLWDERPARMAEGSHRLAALQDRAIQTGVRLEAVLTEVRDGRRAVS